MPASAQNPPNPPNSCLKPKPFALAEHVGTETPNHPHAALWSTLRSLLISLVVSVVQILFANVVAAPTAVFLKSQSEGNETIAATSLSDDVIDELFYVSGALFLWVATYKLFMANQGPAGIRYIATHSLANTSIAFMTCVLHCMNPEGVGQYARMLYLSLLAAEFFSSSSRHTINPRALPVGRVPCCRVTVDLADLPEGYQILINNPEALKEAKRGTVEIVEILLKDSEDVIDPRMFAKLFRYIGSPVLYDQNYLFDKLTQLLEFYVLSSVPASRGKIFEAFVNDMQTYTLIGQIAQVVNRMEKLSYISQLVDRLNLAKGKHLFLSAYMSRDLRTPLALTYEKPADQEQTLLVPLVTNQVFLLAGSSFVPLLVGIWMHSNLCMGDMSAEGNHLNGWVAALMSSVVHVWQAQALVRKELFTPRALFALFPRFGMTLCLVVLACMSSSVTLGLFLAALVNFSDFTKPAHEVVLPPAEEKPKKKPKVRTTGYQIDAEGGVEMVSFTSDGEETRDHGPDYREFTEVFVEGSDEEAAADDDQDYRALEEKEDEPLASEQNSGARGFVDVDLTESEEKPKPPVDLGAFARQRFEEVQARIQVKKERLQAEKERQQALLDEANHQTNKFAGGFIRALTRQQKAIAGPEAMDGDYRPLAPGVEL